MSTTFTEYPITEPVQPVRVSHAGRLNELLDQVRESRIAGWVGDQRIAIKDSLGDWTIAALKWAVGLPWSYVRTCFYALPSWKRRSPGGAVIALRSVWNLLSDPDGRFQYKTSLGSEESSVITREQHWRAIRMNLLAAFLILATAASVGAFVWFKWTPHVLRAVLAFVFGYAFKFGTPLVFGLAGMPAEERAREKQVHPKQKKRYRADDIIRAIETLEIGRITRALRTDERAIRATVGYDSKSQTHHAVVTLPGGATAKDVIDKRDALCSALVLHDTQVMVSGGETANQVVIELSRERMDRRDPGAPPAVTAKSLDISGPIIIGSDGMARPTALTVPQALAIIGQSGSGKSVAGQGIAGTTALDAIADLFLWDGKGGGDYAPFAPVAKAVAIGDAAEEPEVMVTRGQAIIDILGVAASTRSQWLLANGKTKVTPEMGRTIPGLHPIVAIFDESHYLLQDKKAKESFIRLVKRCRSTNIRLVLLSTEIDGTIIDHNLIGLFTRRISLRLSNGAENTTMNGNASVRQGFDATNPDIPTGQAIIRGEEGGLRRCQLFDFTEDQLEAIGEKALQLRGGPVEKIDLDKVAPPKESEPAKQSKRAGSAKFPELLSDILQLAEPDDQGSLQFRQIVERLPTRPEYEPFVFDPADTDAHKEAGNELAVLIRAIVGSKTTTAEGKPLVRDVNKKKQGRGTAAGIYISELNDYLNGTPS